MLSDYWRRESEVARSERRILASPPHVYERNAIPTQTNPAGQITTRWRTKHEMAVNRRIQHKIKDAERCAT
jgi:hypothetical protein